MDCSSLREMVEQYKGQSILFFDEDSHHNQKLSEHFIKCNYNIAFENLIENLKKQIESKKFEYVVLNPTIDHFFNSELIEYVLNTDTKLLLYGDKLDIRKRDLLLEQGVVDFIKKENSFEDSFKKTIKILTRHIINSQFTIFLVDNNEERLATLENRFKAQNYQTLPAKSALEFFTMFETEGDLVVISSSLDDVDTLSVLKAIQKDPKKSHIPVIVIAESYDAEYYVDVLDCGGKDCIFEPYSMEEILIKLKIWIEHVNKYYENRCSKQLLEEYKDAVDVSAIVSKTTPSGIITYVNEAFCKISGYSKEELIGQPHKIVRHPDMPAAAFEDMWNTIKSKKTWSGIVKNRKKDGGYYYVDSVVKPIINEYGKIVEYIGLRKDITEIQDIKEQLSNELNIKEENLEYALKLSKEYEKAIDESNILSRTDVDGNIIYANKQFYEISGFSPKEVLGMSHNIVRHPENTDVLYADMWNTITQGKVWKGRLMNMAKDGSTYYVNTVIFPIKDHNGEIIEFMAIRHNITEIINLHKDIESTQREVIHKMGEIGESRSKETGHHVKRVAEYSRVLGKAYGMSDDEANLLADASPMHDIGKVAIPDSILNKPGRLTEEEFTAMQKHTEIGYNVLSGSNRDLLKAAQIVAYEHHEKYNGKGYPRGLKKDEIHIYGRITAIADVFDALGSDRVYKKAWDDEKIFNLFKEERGEHFDPKLIDLFFDNLDEILDIRKRYDD